ncbi:MAG: acyltransferase [Chitinophagaceae bacterium]
MSNHRIVYIDNIKVFLTCLVIAHHAAQAYGPTGGAWPILDNNTSNWFRHFFFINASYMMGLFFFISGYFLLFSLNRKTNKEFIVDRLLRLGIPLVFFTLFVFLPFNYLSSNKQLSITNFFLNSYFFSPPIATGHLWFVASLLFYSLAYILIIYFNPKPNYEIKILQFNTYYIFIYIIVLALITGLVRIYYPIDVWRTWFIPVEVAHIPQYCSLFFIGILFNKYQWLSKLNLQKGILFFCVAIFTYSLQLKLPKSITSYWICESFIESLLCVGISIGLLTSFQKFGNKTNEFLKSLSNNSYGIYLFHLLLIIGLQKLFLPFHLNANLKFVIVFLLGTVLSYGLSVMVRKIPFLKRIV